MDRDSHLSSDLLSIVPVILDVDIGGTYVREFVFWNTARRSRRLFEEFAAQTIKDNDLPIGCLEYIAESIEDQVNRYLVLGCSRTAALLTYNLDIWLDGFHYKDTIIWDAANTMNSVVDFAVETVRDLGLGVAEARDELPLMRVGLRVADTYAQRRCPQIDGLLDGLTERQRRWVSCIVFQMIQQTQQQALLSYKSGLFRFAQGETEMPDATGLTGSITMSPEYFTEIVVE